VVALSLPSGPDGGMYWLLAFAAIVLAGLVVLALIQRVERGYARPVVNGDWPTIAPAPRGPKIVRVRRPYDWARDGD